MQFVNADEMRDIAFSAPGPQVQRRTWLRSRELVAEIRQLPIWRPKRLELWNQYVFLRGVHKLNWEFQNGRTLRPGEMAWR
jgi:hypothetical protein